MKNIVAICILFFLSHALVAQDQLQTVKNVLEDLKTYRYGLPETWKPDMLLAMQPVYASEQLQVQVEPLMLEFLLSDASLAAKRAISKELAAIATPKAEKTLFKLLKKEKTATLALDILAMADLGAIDQLAKSLKKANLNTRIGIINLLGERGDTDAVELLVKQYQSAAKKEAEAIAFALAKIGTPEAADFLLAIEEPEDAIYQAQILCGFNLIANGFTRDAQAIFSQVYHTTDFLPLKTAALNGLFELSDDKENFLLQKLDEVKEDLRSEVIRLVIKLPENYQNGKKLLNNNNLTSQDKRQLLTILADRGDPSIHANAVQLLKQENEPLLRKTALLVIPKIGTVQDVELLAQLARQFQGEEKQLAESALFTLPGKAVDRQIIRLLEESNDDLKVVLIRAIGERNMEQASNELFKLASSENIPIKLEAIEALGKVAGANDLSAAIDLLLANDSRRERRSIEEAVYLIAARSGDRSASSAAIKKQLSQSTDIDNQISLISILGKLANPEDFLAMAEYLHHENSEVQSALLRAWEQWPDNQPLDALEKFLEITDDARQHALAMKSYLQIVDINENMDAEAKLLKLDLAQKFAQHLLEKRMVIAGYSKIHEPASLTALTGLMQDKEVSAEVEAAIQEVASRIWENNEWVNAQLEKIIELSDRQKFIDQLKEEINRRTN